MKKKKKLPPLPKLKPQFSETAKVLNKQIDDMHLTRKEPEKTEFQEMYACEYPLQFAEQGPRNIAPSSGEVTYCPDIKMESLLSPTMIENIGWLFIATGLMAIGWLFRSLL